MLQWAIIAVSVLLCSLSPSLALSSLSLHLCLSLTTVHLSCLVAFLSVPMQPHLVPKHTHAHALGLPYLYSQTRLPVWAVIITTVNSLTSWWTRETRCAQSHHFFFLSNRCMSYFILSKLICIEGFDSKIPEWLSVTRRGFLYDKCSQTLASVQLSGAWRKKHSSAQKAQLFLCLPKRRSRLESS